MRDGQLGRREGDDGAEADGHGEQGDHTSMMPVVTSREDVGPHAKHPSAGLPAERGRVAGRQGVWRTRRSSLQLPALSLALTEKVTA